ncbi:hypothetical protein JT358_04705 [Micrococcales bacterium 31B]|nr:hypothetical protein [Micrococcales bacterium 31B]
MDLLAPTPEAPTRDPAARWALMIVLTMAAITPFVCLGLWWNAEPSWLLLWAQAAASLVGALAMLAYSVYALRTSTSRTHKATSIMFTVVLAYAALVTTGDAYYLTYGLSNFQGAYFAFGILFIGPALQVCGATYGVFVACGGRNHDPDEL